MLGAKLRRDFRCNHSIMRPRSLLLLLLAALSLGLLAGCGGGDDNGNEADSGTDANQLLKDTFTGKKDIKSGKLDVSATVASGGQSFALKLTGPFSTTGSGKVPQLDLEASVEGGGQNLNVGLTTTEDKAFVSYNDTAYEIPAQIYQQIKTQYEQQAGQTQDQQSLASLGLDPSSWMTNVKNAGDAKVGDTDTVKITGDVDVDKLLQDVNKALGKIRALGGANTADLPDQLSESDMKQAKDAIKQLSVEVYTGADDKILRRLVLNIKLEVPSGGSTESGDVKFDMQLLDLNEDQEITAPENPKPFNDLMQQLQQLGLGGSLGGLGGASGSGSGSGGGTSQENLEKYSQCIQDANGDNNKIRKCADMLTP
jgi:hypothetical protein